MIPINELRLGNIVNYVRADFVIMTKIIDCKLLSILTDEKNNIGRLVHKPIPITEEWLLKFGADKRLSRYNINQKYCIQKYSDDKGWYFSIYISGYPDYSIHILCFIKYVHQLQNLYYALTGEELTLSVT